MLGKYFLIVTAFWGTLFIGGPTNLYFTNLAEFSISYSTLLLYLVPAFFISLVCTLALVACLGEEQRQRVLAVIFFFAVLLWLEGNLLVRDYGILDGRKIDWAANRFFSIVDVCIWIGGLMLAVVFYSKVNRIARLGAVLIIAIQVVSNGLLWFQAPETIAPSHLVVDQKDKFLFSSQKNVIILVLDSFRSDIFQAIADENPQIKSDLQGFTFFRNSLSGFPITYPAVPLILTGQYYDNTVPIQSFMKEAYTTSSISKALKDAGYNAQIYPFEYFEKTVYLDESVASNFVKTDIYNREDGKKTAYLWDITLFRYFPHLLKPAIYNEEQWLFSNRLFRKANPPAGNASGASSANFDAQAYKVSKDLQFISAMLDQTQVTRNTPVFKYYHLKGLHAPLMTDENLHFASMVYNEPNYKRHAVGTVRLVQLFLRKLKEIGVYDHSLIVIMGDHGSAFGVRTAKDRNFLSVDASLSEVMGQSRPAFLIKRIQNTEPYTVSDVPVSHGDICQTIAKEVGLTATFPGKSVFDVKKAETRVRKFLFGRFRIDLEQSDFLSPFIEYEVSGPSWVESSWRKTGKIFYPPKTKQSQHTVQYQGQPVTFGVGGSYQTYKNSGWGQDDHTYTILGDEPAHLSLPGLQANPLLLRVLLSPLEKTHQPKLIIKAAGQPVAEWTVDHQGEYQTKIPAEYVKNELNLTFEVGTKVAINRLVAAGYYSFGNPISFGIGGNAEQYQAGGWSHPEAGLTWTNGREAVLTIPLLDQTSSLLLTAKVSSYLNPPKLPQQRAEIYIGDTKLDTWIVEKYGAYSCIVPKQYFAEGVVSLRFKLPDAIRPVDIGADAMDFRLLGLQFQSVRMEPIEEYRYDQTLTFGKNGTIGRYLGLGWGEPQEGFTWNTNSKEATLAMPLAVTNSNLRLKLQLTPLTVAGKLDAQRVAIRANGVDIEELRVDKPGTYTATIPKEAMGGPVLKLTFLMPDSVSQYELGINEDKTILGVQFGSITISEMRE